MKSSSINMQPFTTAALRYLSPILPALFLIKQQIHRPNLLS